MMEEESPHTSAADSDCSADDEATSSSEQYKKHRKTLNWLSMREKQLRVAIHYEKYKRSVPDIEDSDLICKKISELDIKLDELKHEKRMADQLHSTHQMTATLQYIAAPKKSRYSEQQIKCIKDLMMNIRILNKQKDHKQKEIIALEEEMEAIQKQDDDLKNKKKSKKGGESSSCGTNEQLKEIKIKTTQVAHRNQLLARAIHSLSKHCISNGNLPPKNKKELQPLVFACKQVMQSRLDDEDHIYALFHKIDKLKI